MDIQNGDLYSQVAIALEKSGVKPTNSAIKTAVNQIVKAATYFAHAEFDVESVKQEVKNSIQKVESTAQNEIADLVLHRKRQLSEIEHVFNEVKNLDQKTEKLNEMLGEWTEKRISLGVEKQTLKSDLAKDMVTLFNIISQIGIDNGADPNVATRCASYSAWALATNGASGFGELEEIKVAEHRKQKQKQSNVQVR